MNVSYNSKTYKITSFDRFCFYNYNQKMIFVRNQNFIPKFLLLLPNHSFNFDKVIIEYKY